MWVFFSRQKKIVTPHQFQFGQNRDFHFEEHTGEKFRKYQVFGIWVISWRSQGGRVRNAAAAHKLDWVVTLLQFPDNPRL